MSWKQSTNTILMVPPLGFKFNPETAATNAFQIDVENIQGTAMNEFNLMVDVLREKGINVILFNQADHLPDAIFPNNWFSTHAEGDLRSMVLYPMLTPNRQQEVQEKNLLDLLLHNNIQYDRVYDLRKDSKGVLEGTGSLVLDRQNKIAYAALSPRTSKNVVYKFSKLLNYKTFIFEVIPHPYSVYHTNIMMSISDSFALVCLEAMRSDIERRELVATLAHTNHEVIEIAYSQLYCMCANIISVENNKKEKMLLMSKMAYQAYTPDQLEKLQSYGEIITIEIPSIEKVGGGSVRCMIAEIF